MIYHRRDVYVFVRYNDILKIFFTIDLKHLLLYISISLYHKVVYYQAVAEGIFNYEEDSELHHLFNNKEEEVIGMLRTVYINDEKTSSLDKIKSITFPQLPLMM